MAGVCAMSQQRKHFTRQRKVVGVGSFWAGLVKFEISPVRKLMASLFQLKKEVQMTMLKLKAWTYDDYLALPEGGPLRYEVIDGELDPCVQHQTPKSYQ
jgi:hypothetical protein